MAASLVGADGFLQHSISQMYRATADDRGTVQALARQLDETDEDGMHVISASSEHCLMLR